MTHLTDAGVLVAAASSVLYVLLGAWIWTVTPRRQATKLLAAFAVSFGLWFAAKDVLPVVHGAQWLVWPAFSIVGVGVGFLSLALAASVPDRLEDRRLLAVSVGIGFVFAAVAAATYYVRWTNNAFVAGDGGALFYLSGLANAVGWKLLTMGATWAAATLLALRAHRSQQPTRSEVVQLAILGVAFALFWTFLAGTSVLGAARALSLREPVNLVYGAAHIAPWFVVAGLWGRNMAAADRRTTRIHRTAMLTFLAVLLAGAIVLALFADSLFWSATAGGIVRTLGVGLLAYGILRHDLAGLDAKVEYGVSKTTVAGIFVAAFFIAGELAETFFGDVLGSEYVGVIAAGMLVFAISPLQRMADSFAAKAVPGGAKAGAGIEAQYRAAVEMALADGEITDVEERRLAEKAEQLGLGHARALELRKEVEAEALEDG